LAGKERILKRAEWLWGSQKTVARRSTGVAQKAIEEVAKKKGDPSPRCEEGRGRSLDHAHRGTGIHQANGGEGTSGGEIKAIKQQPDEKRFCGARENFQNQGWPAAGECEINESREREEKGGVEVPCGERKHTDEK